MKNNRKLWLLIGMLILMLLVAACGSDPTPTAEPEAVATEETSDDESAEIEESDDEEAESDDAEEEEEAESDDTDAEEAEEESAPVAVEGVADTFPCAASIIPSDDSLLSIRYREPTTDESLMIGRMRPETPISVIEAREVDDVLWYRAVDANNSNVNLNWIAGEYVVITEACISD